MRDIRGDNIFKKNKNNEAHQRFIDSIALIDGCICISLLFVLCGKHTGETLNNALILIIYKIKHEPTLLNV